jgi:hypothetical protein
MLNLRSARAARKRKTPTENFFLSGAKIFLTHNFQFLISRAEFRCQGVLMRGINLRLSPVESVTYFADGQSLLIARMPTRLPGDLLNFLGRRDDFSLLFFGMEKKRMDICALAGGKYIKICDTRVSVLSSRWQKVSGGKLISRIAPRGAIEMKVCM